MCWYRLWDALNNASLAATIGAVLATVGAVTTVFITDWLRTRRKARVAIPSLLRRQRTLAANRRAAEEEAVADRGRNQASSQPPFSIEPLSRLAESVADRLVERQQQGLDNIIHLMREAESLAAKTQGVFGQIQQASASPARGDSSPRVGIPMLENLLDQSHAEAASVLRRLEKLIDAYLAATLNEFGSIAPEEGPSE